MPTEIISGRDSVLTHKELFRLGKKAIIVCGKKSAKSCGALDDVTAVLNEQQITWTVFNEITENPPVSICYRGGQLAASENADFVVAIGGGSPIDAAKAIAAYAANPSIAPNDIFTAELKPSLPIIAIPTTAGTGSEVNPFSVMTIDEKNVKKTFKSSNSYPKYSFLDPKYTESLSYSYTVSTALDALCHCVESYMSPKSTDLSRAIAVMGAKKIYATLKKIEALGQNVGKEELKSFREDLLSGACAGGIAINTTGTGFNHPLGYNLTLDKGVPHGRACGMFMEEYFAYNSKSEEGKRLISDLCSEIGEKPEKLAAKVVLWSDKGDIHLSAAEIETYVEKVKGAGNYANSPYVISSDEMKEIYSHLFA